MKPSINLYNNCAVNTHYIMNNLHIGQTVYWKNMFGIWNYGKIESIGGDCVSVILPIDEENYAYGQANRSHIVLNSSQYTTTSPYKKVA
jgi:hypothetical protein